MATLLFQVKESVEAALHQTIQQEEDKNARLEGVVATQGSQ